MSGGAARAVQLLAGRRVHHRSSQGQKCRRGRRRDHGTPSPDRPARVDFMSRDTPYTQRGAKIKKEPSCAVARSPGPYPGLANRRRPASAGGHPATQQRQLAVKPSMQLGSGRSKSVAVCRSRSRSAAAEPSCGAACQLRHHRPKACLAHLAQARRAGAGTAVGSPAVRPKCISAPASHSGRQRIASERRPTGLKTQLISNIRPSSRSNMGSN